MIIKRVKIKENSKKYVTVKGNKNNVIVKTYCFDRTFHYKGK